MVQNADFYTLISEKIATPLTMAAEEFSMRDEKASKDADRAKQIAAMLAKITSLSIKAMDKLDIKEYEEKDGDALRLGLAGVSTPMVANFFRMKGQMPEDTDVEKFVSSIETVATFGKNFDIASDHVLKLKTLDGVTVEGDKNFVHLQYLQIFAPIMATIQTFSFGMPEQKMLQEVTEKLVARAKSLADELFPDIDKGKAVFAQLSILRTLTMLFTQAHMGQMAKMMTATGADKPNITLADVWKQFDKTVAMISTLATGFFSDEPMEQASAPVEVEVKSPEAPVEEKAPAPEIKEEAAVEVKPAAKEEVAVEVKSPEAPPPAPVAEEEKKPEEEKAPEAKTEEKSESGDSSDPMSFFVKKD